MAREALLLGVDVGTSSCKAVLMDASGAAVSHASREYPISMPRPLWSEQNPEDWWTGTCGAVADALRGHDARRVATIGLTGQMHGLVALDERSRVLRPAILWNDQRTQAECDELTRAAGHDKVLRITGNPILTGFTAPKLAWLRRHEPDVYARIAHVLLPKDFVRLRLSGALATDVADASGTSMLDVPRRAWSDELLRDWDFPRSWLPEVHESTAVCAKVSRTAAASTGLIEGTPIVAGAGDQAAQAIGEGITAQGQVSITIGTSGVVFAALDRYRADGQGRLHAFCHALPGRWHLMGVMLAAGASLAWLSDLFDGHDPAALIEQAAGVAAGCEGLTFLPYLSGERTPHADPDARGAWIGLTARHTKAHLARAVLEGVCYGLRDSFELIRAAGVEPGVVRVSGGGAKSRAWREILAGVLGRALTPSDLPHGAAGGAAILAGLGVGAVTDVSAMAREDARADEPPSQAAIDVYAAGYERFRKLYPALKAAGGAKFNE